MRVQWNLIIPEYFDKLSKMVNMLCLELVGRWCNQVYDFDWAISDKTYTGTETEQYTIGLHDLNYLLTDTHSKTSITVWS